MSVGHVARALEEAGIPTVAVFIRAFRDVAEAMTLPRVLVAPHLMGRTIGPPGAEPRQREVVTSALRLFETATGPGTVVDLRPATAAWHAERSRRE
ncbi:MAG: hypothetical protein KY462_09885 [Actinobacteria bacterium]|nr:hypothetical protein [Actinomycetota bacterium]